MLKGATLVIVFLLCPRSLYAVKAKGLHRKLDMGARTHGFAAFGSEFVCEYSRGSLRDNRRAVRHVTHRRP